MASNTKARPERKKTDESLRTERATADRALSDRLDAVEEYSDLVIQRARDHADSVLEKARAEADNKLERALSRLSPRASVSENRLREDVAVREERASADDARQWERDESRRSMASVLPLERETTDRFLLTERSRADEELTKRDDFLGIVSHDLRNLLGGIALSAATLVDLSPENEAATKRIQRYVARMNRLIGDLLDVVSIDAGQLSVTPEHGDVSALITEAVDTFKEAAAAKGVSLTADLASEPLKAKVDHDRMIQVLANLLANALKFTQQGGSIVVHGESVGDRVRVVVVDDGPGIPAGMHERIFERFWQVGRDGSGSGLGLCISRHIIEAHHGEIHAESPVAGGSRFVITLPSSLP
jgi:signal transduction histidine kinase